MLRPKPHTLWWQLPFSPVYHHTTNVVIPDNALTQQTLSSTGCENVCPLLQYVCDAVVLWGYHDSSYSLLFFVVGGPRQVIYQFDWINTTQIVSCNVCHQSSLIRSQTYYILGTAQEEHAAHYPSTMLPYKCSTSQTTENTQIPDFCARAESHVSI